MYIIYKAISPSGKIYIGQTANLYNRQKLHKNSSLNEKSKEYNLAFHCAIRKYGFENVSWQTLNENLSKEQANMWERLWIFVEKSNNSQVGYNETEGGENPPILCGDNHPMKRPEVARKVSEAKKGIKFSLQHKLKLSENHADVSGEKNPFFGKKRSLQSRIDQSNRQKGKPSPKKGKTYKRNDN